MTAVDLLSQAAEKLPAAVVRRERSLIRSIARNARRRLGRPARRGHYLDVKAIDAVLAAAEAAGVETRVLRWAVPGASLTRLARGLVYRAAQSYGRVKS